MGEGWVMPMVLMKAFEMKRRSFTLIRWNYRGIVAGFLGKQLNRNKLRRILYTRACRSGGGRIHLKMSE
ncbi:hypothetical protein HDF08_001008 [Edaphobacter lichenicola]|uniref:Uncharacterized protein n=1 Tax=Tunturiibacter lichenicola TaxID=2051959 RepID=A0A852VCD1_9BACT|nr:hypothetical protein [Edaphobacter lichenicola]